MDTMSVELKGETNIVILAAAKLRNDNLTLSEDNEYMKADADQSLLM